LIDKKETVMRIANPIVDGQPIYVGKCKGNAAPKHVSAEGVEKQSVKLDGKKATIFNSPKSAEYLYMKVGDNWLYVKDKSIFGQTELKTVAVTRSPEGQPEGQVEA
jgi:hypothetical protein